MSPPHSPASHKPRTPCRPVVLVLSLKPTSLAVRVFLAPQQIFSGDAVSRYPEGPGILSELIQNADDAGATVVKVMLNRRTYKSSSLLSPKMAEWQGPGLQHTIVRVLLCVVSRHAFVELASTPCCDDGNPVAAVYVYNNVEFSARDFENLSRIGQASKMDKLTTTGRFGLGFNSVYHFTGRSSIA